MKYFVVLVIVFVCVQFNDAKPKAPLTNCQRQKAEAEQLNKGPNGDKKNIYLVPNCDSDGNFEALQCHGKSIFNTRACQCWDKQGQVISRPSFKITTCKCITEKHEAEKNGKLAPECEANGDFKSD